MTVTVRQIAPCILVIPKVSCKGGITTEREDLDKFLDDSGETVIWKTTKVIADPDEHKDSRKLRRDLKKKLLNFGMLTSIGIVVSHENLDKVKEVAEDIQEEVVEFNSYSEYVTMSFRMPIFHFTGDNEAAVSVVIDDLKDTLSQMKTAVENVDLKGIKNVVKRLKNYETVLPEDAAKVVVEAVESAKAQAKEFRKKLNKEGQALEEVRKTVDLNPINLARLALIDDSEDIDVDISKLQGQNLANRMEGILDEN
ncbi:MAG: hypothetical protein KAS32_19560 [Candidatus Peribacteraceae bacterium]|nr:hypothetical protein [Candidatus Peribacteraceae bacterium]